MSHVTDRPQQYPEPSAQRLPREWMKIAAALIAFVAVGSLLAIIFRGNNDTPNAGAPLVTPTASVAPSATQASATSTISGVAASASATMSATMSVPPICNQGNTGGAAFCRETLRRIAA